jgi:hypothetical protein
MQIDRESSPLELTVNRYVPAVSAPLFAANSLFFVDRL